MGYSKGDRMEEKQDMVHLNNKWVPSSDFHNKLMKGKTLRKHSLHEKTAAWFYWSRSSVVVNDATPLTPPSAFSNINNTHVHSMIHNSNLFSEYLGTHCTLELWPQPMYKVNRILMADSEKEISACGNFIWVNSINSLCFAKHLGRWTTFVLNNLTSAYF